jgi:hypothetical protein
MTIYYLMVKIHNITGLKYLCQTTKKDYTRYIGSGKYWLEHLRQHGKFIKTELLKECQTREELRHWGIHYSTLWDVVNSKDKTGKKIWANLTPEKGTGGKTREISANKGKMIARDKFGNTTLVTITDERILSGELVSINKGTVLVQDSQGNKLRVKIGDPRLVTKELIPLSKGKITVKNKNNEFVRVDKDDERIKTGELNYVFCGKITARDNLGNTFKVDVSDKRYKSGELKALAQGMVSVVDQNGKTFKVSTNDPRYLSGELKFHGGPKKGFKHESRKCPHCGKIGSGSNMTRFHFNNCKNLLGPFTKQL